MPTYFDSKTLRFFCGFTQDALALCADRNFNGSGDALATRDLGFDFSRRACAPPLLLRSLRASGLILSKQSEQQVFRLNVRTSVLAGFVAGEEDYAAGFLCVSFKHRLFSNLRGAAGAAHSWAFTAGESCRGEDTTRKIG